jgi:hypothetical protein
MSCALTQDYKIDNNAFYGGITTVYLIEKQNVKVSSINGVIVSISKSVGKFYRKYELVSEENEAIELETVNEFNGVLDINQLISLPINGMSVSVRNEIELLAKNRLNIILIDSNGFGWMYGKDFGLRLLETNAGSGKVLLDRNGYDLTFEGEEMFTAAYVSSDLINALQVPGAPIYFKINGANFSVNRNRITIN